MDKKELIGILEEIAVLLELKGENPFKTRAYTNAARSLEQQTEDIRELIQSGGLSDIKGIGKGLSEKITDFVINEKMDYYEDLKKSIPPGLIEMLKIPGLGPKRIKVLNEKLGVSSIGELEYACIENRLVELDGFGQKSQNNILAGIEQVKKFSRHHLFSYASRTAETIYDKLKPHKDFIRISPAGSIRRKKEVVKDIDFIASVKDKKKAGDFFASLEEVEKIIAQGETKVSVLLKSGINVDLRIVDDDEYTYALHHFTGSMEHNTILRSLAKKKGLKINEYGIFRDEKRIECKDETEFYKTLNLNYIPPELREGLQEVNYAGEKEIPALIEEKDIRGVIHVHTSYSDGALSVKEMAEAAQDMGYDYIGFTDHSKSAFYAHGLTEERIIEQHKEINALNKEMKNFRILKGIESDILPDGSLDYPDEILASFDFVVASVHGNFKMTEKEMTERIIKAVRNKYTSILGHPTGRLLLSREPYNVDLPRIIDEAAENNVVIELNANPHRLDIDWRELPYAFEKNVKISINPDAHSIRGIGDIRYGVGVARKGWTTKNNVVNTLPCEDFLKALKR